MYIFFNSQIFMGKVLKKDKKGTEQLKKYLVQKDIDITSKEIKNFTHYMYNYAYYPVYDETGITFLKSGEETYNELLKKLKLAKKYIFMEYFIIKDGKMWQDILNILKQKIKEGVEVRIMYDGLGTGPNFPKNYQKMLRSIGIKCRVFNPFIAFLSTYQNNRDHRKITIVDGVYAFTGGINIADEYCNFENKFGHWKDNSILISGKAVDSFVIMFLSLWNIHAVKKENYNIYLESKTFKNNSLIIPFSDSPLDDKEIGKEVYLSIINTAKSYIYITSPYLIVDYELINALKYASRRGIEVIIITPHIPDKKYIYILSRTYYLELMEAGVKIFEYTPGFIHSKNVISDNTKAVVGTINLDYRSLYLHYECGVYIYNSEEIKNMHQDFLTTLKKCEEIKVNNINKKNIFIKILEKILRLFSPLM